MAQYICSQPAWNWRRHLFGEFSDRSYASNANQSRAAAQVTAWAILNDTSHSHAYRGSLVVPDSRNVSTNSRAGGPRIKGSLSCMKVDDYVIITNGTSTQYLIRIGPEEYSAPPGEPLATVMVGAGMAVARYIWVSSALERIPNATRTSDDVMSIALCTHEIYFVEDLEGVGGVQDINPSVPLTPGCSIEDPNVCASDAVNKAIINWWGGSDRHFLGLNCRGSVLGPLPSSGFFDEDNCPLTEVLWSETVTSMLDGIVQTSSNTTGITTQKLTVPGETVNSRRWWLQALIPSLTLVHYIVGLVYTTVISQGRNVLKDLTLTEIIGAAQTQYIRALLDSEALAKAVIQYECQAGFIVPYSPRARKRHVEKSTSVSETNIV
ncbi:hypothetical protein BDZ94DRAFT_1325854 [Collybia nuda]|uniref:Uncharacterized protein n=1 Tax=Collybia nuda TaxID=64659 RepID=A0A9P5XYC7_9AGAR|nr:hypothetical protein BDZ94DRAFT_1325854 [Collybia nuda]